VLLQVELEMYLLFHFEIIVIRTINLVHLLLLGQEF
jgi:hypothetical protein